MIAVSRCLLGDDCRYDGKTPAVKCRRPDALMLSAGILPICPECAGGMSVPRYPCEIVMKHGSAYLGGEAILKGEARVINSIGEDMTEYFVTGAQATLALIKEYGCCVAYLKDKSPSCGVGQIYDGSFTHTLTVGDGVLAALLKQNNIPAYAVSENNISWRIIHG